MFYDEVVVSELLDVSCSSPIDMVGFFVVFKVFVVGEDGGGER